MSKRKIIALYIDSFFIAMLCAFVQSLLNIKNVVFFMLFYFGFALLLFIIRPLLFKNASVGMRIMHIMIVDKDGQIPPKKQILKRQCLTPLILFQWIKFQGCDTAEWELMHIGTQIILKK